MTTLLLPDHFRSSYIPSYIHFQAAYPIQAMSAGQAEQPHMYFHSEILCSCSMGQYSSTIWEMYFSFSRLCPAVYSQKFMLVTEIFKTRHLKGHVFKEPKQGLGFFNDLW